MHFRMHSQEGMGSSHRDLQQISCVLLYRAAQTPQRRMQRAQTSTT